jgi:hypothetical protein
MGSRGVVTAGVGDDAPLERTELLGIEGNRLAVEPAPVLDSPFNLPSASRMASASSAIRVAE